MTLNKILVPLNFTPHSANALIFAIELMGSMKASITCLHVIEDPGIVISNFLSKELYEKIRREAEIKLLEFTKNVLGEKSIMFDIIISKGKVYKSILDTIDLANINYVVMGKSDSLETNNFKTGTNSRHMITNAQVPVILVGSKVPKSINNLLFPLDLNKPVRGKIERLLEIIENFETKVNIITLSRNDSEEVQEQLTTKINKIKEIFLEQNITCEIKVITSKKPITKTFENIVNESGVNMVFLMTQQETDTIEQFIGSTAHQIINKSSIPTITVRPEYKSENFGAY